MADYENKCAYRIKVEELITQGKTVPTRLETCENCTGYKTHLECSDYLDLDHLLHFRGLHLERRI